MRPNVVKRSVVNDDLAGALAAELHWNGELVWRAANLPGGDPEGAAALVRSESQRRWPKLRWSSGKTTRGRKPAQFIVK
jgi:hypothetical protein